MKTSIRKIIKDSLLNNGWSERDSEYMLVTLAEDGYDATITLETIRMPFGKYEGISIKTLDKENTGYLGWLIEQDWFESKFDYIYKAILDMGYVPSKMFEDSSDDYLDTENIPF